MIWKGTYKSCKPTILDEYEKRTRTVFYHDYAQYFVYLFQVNKPFLESELNESVSAETVVSWVAILLPRR